MNCLDFIPFWLKKSHFFVYVCLYMCVFKQRESFKKRWFTLCSMSRKLLYFKTPLVMIKEY